MSTRAPGGRKGWSGWSSTLISWGEGVDVMVFIMQGFGVMNEARKHEGLDVRRRVRTREAESARSQARECALTGPRVRTHFWVSVWSLIFKQIGSRKKQAFDHLREGRFSW